jgi:hypothetical protein
MVRDGMPVLDLHGLRHDQVEHEVHKFLHENEDMMPCKIVMGLSGIMRTLVTGILDEMSLYYHDEKFQNPGCLVIQETKWWK